MGSSRLAPQSDRARDILPGVVANCRSRRRRAIVYHRDLKNPVSDFISERIKNVQETSKHPEPESAEHRSKPLFPGVLAKGALKARPRDPGAFFWPARVI